MITTSGRYQRRDFFDGEDLGESESSEDEDAIRPSISLEHTRPAFARREAVASSHGHISIHDGLGVAKALPVRSTFRVARDDADEVDLTGHGTSGDAALRRLAASSSASSSLSREQQKRKVGSATQFRTVVSTEKQDYDEARLTSAINPASTPKQLVQSGEAIKRLRRSAPLSWGDVSSRISVSPVSTSKTAAREI
jgi:hypothetical protein